MRLGKHPVLISALLFLAFASPNASAEWSCDILMHAVSDKEMADAWGGFGSIERDVLAGKKSPAWSDFDRLDKLVSYLKRYKTNLESGSKLIQFDTDLKSIEKALKDELKFDPDLTSAEISAETYLPGDYELRLVYRRYLNELNEIFPGSLLKFPALPAPKFSKVDLVAQAETLLAKRSAEVEKTLSELNPEFKTWDDYQKWIKAKVDTTPEGSDERQFMRLLENPSAMSYRMRRPVNGRFWIRKTGFQNQFVTKSSRGTLDLERRLSAEIEMLGADESYKALDMGLRAKYGYLQLPESSNLQVFDMATQYGEDIYVFKYENVKNRTTFTIGDSLSYSGYGKHPKSFGQFFSPLSKLSFVEPFIGRIVGDPVLLSLTDLPRGFNNIGLNNRYLEVQFFAPMDLDDVGEFIFTTTPPEGGFLKDLQSRGIKIKDGTKDSYHPVDWVPVETDPDAVGANDIYLKKVAVK